MRCSDRAKRPPTYEADVVVLGAGFFGCEIALELRNLGFDRVAIVEREAGIMRRASYVNQARVHSGYHYPRALHTAYRSHVNFQRFLDDHAYAVQASKKAFYAIAHGSKVNPTQFERLCRIIGAPCARAPASIERLFDSERIEAVYGVREVAFDTRLLATHMRARLAKAGVTLLLSTPAWLAEAGDRAVDIEAGGTRLRSRFVINATYANLDHVGIRLRSSLKRELAELVLLRPPAAIADIGVTVMDGPFFSVMPFPPAALHSLSHVRYTPHEAWTGPCAPKIPRHSNAERMVRDSARYLPCLSQAEIVSSLFEIKTVLRRSEQDDGRPVLFEVSPDSPRVISIMGGKLDNVYEALDAVRCHQWVN